MFGVPESGVLHRLLERRRRFLCRANAPGGPREKLGRAPYAYLISGGTALLHDVGVLGGTPRPESFTGASSRPAAH